MVARRAMYIEENFTVFPMSVSVERRERSDSTLTLLRLRRRYEEGADSRAEAATISTPTYANVAIDRHILQV
jgi:hypothetical protein